MLGYPGINLAKELINHFCHYHKFTFGKWKGKCIGEIMMTDFQYIKWCIDNIPEFKIGDTVKVYYKVIEGDKERVQAYEGTVIARKNKDISETFTVRKISSGVGVEKTFPLHSPKIEKIEVVRRGSVRRAKLNYMRERTGKAAKIKTKEDK